jgi:hypothetical protein
MYIYIEDAAALADEALALNIRIANAPGAPRGEL